MKVIITTNCKKVKDKFVKLKDKLPSALNNSTEAITDGFVLALKDAAPVWTGRLKGSIHKEKTGKNEYVIKIVRYGIVADSGRRPGKVPFATIRGFTKLQLWAGSKGIPYWALRKHIENYGTLPTNYINRAVSNFEYSMVMRKVMSDGINKAIRDSGIGTKTLGVI